MNGLLFALFIWNLVLTFYVVWLHNRLNITIGLLHKAVVKWKGE